MFEEPILWSDMVDVARPWTKWAAEVAARAGSAQRAVRRAIQTGAHAADGPGVSFAADRRADGGRRARSHAERRPLNTRVRPPQEAIRQAAEVLRRGRRIPAILSGSRVAERDAVAELGRDRRAAGRLRHHRVGHHARPLGLSGRSSAFCAGLAALVTGGARAADGVRRAAGRRHGPACGNTSITSRRGRSPSTSGWCTSTRTLADRQELSRSRSACWGDTQDRPARSWDLLSCLHDGRTDTSKRPASATCRARSRHQRGLAANCKPRSPPQRELRPLTPLDAHGQPGPHPARQMWRSIEEAVTTTNTTLRAAWGAQEHDRLLRPSRLGAWAGAWAARSA